MGFSELSPQFRNPQKVLNMARNLTTNEQIDDFIQKVIRDAKHHGGNVADIIMPLSQEVRARLNLGPDTVSVWEREGKIGRTCWVELNGRRWAFSYRHKSQKIELRQGTTQGNVEFEFENSTTPTKIATQVTNL